MRNVVAPMLAEVYPQFAKRVSILSCPAKAGHPVIHERQ